MILRLLIRWWSVKGRSYEFSIGGQCAIHSTQKRNKPLLLTLIAVKAKTHLPLNGKSLSRMKMNGDNKELSANELTLKIFKYLNVFVKGP